MSNQYPLCDHCGTRHKQCEPSSVERAGLDYIAPPRREQEFIIPERLDGLNEIIGMARTHWSHSRSQKEATDLIVQSAITKHRVQPIMHPFILEVHYSEPNDKRDPDNIVAAKKFILDALQKKHIIPNDNQKYVKGFRESWGLASPEKPVGVYVKLIEE